MTVVAVMFGENHDVVASKIEKGDRWGDEVKESGSSITGDLASRRAMRGF